MVVDAEQDEDSAGAGVGGWGDADHFGRVVVGEFVGADDGGSAAVDVRGFASVEPDGDLQAADVDQIGHAGAGLDAVTRYDVHRRDDGGCRCGGSGGLAALCGDGLRQRCLPVQPADFVGHLLRRAACQLELHESVFGLIDSLRDPGLGAAKEETPFQADARGPPFARW